jgi:hypothetical protein
MEERRHQNLDISRPVNKNSKMPLGLITSFPVTTLKLTKALAMGGRQKLESSIINELTPPIIVLGMHRSGTSLLTGRLEADGMYAGQVNTAARYNAKGNRENEDLRHFHDLMLASRGYDWKTPPDHPVEWTPEEKAKVLDILRPFVGKELWGFQRSARHLAFGGVSGTLSILQTHCNSLNSPEFPRHLAASVSAAVRSRSVTASRS